MKKSIYKTLLERIYNKPYHDILVYFYVDKNLSIRGVAKELDISPSTVHRDIQQEGIVKKLSWK